MACWPGVLDSVLLGVPCCPGHLDETSLSVTCCALAGKWPQRISSTECVVTTAMCVERTWRVQRGQLHS